MNKVNLESLITEIEAHKDHFKQGCLLTVEEEEIPLGDPAMKLIRDYKPDTFACIVGRAYLMSGSNSLDSAFQAVELWLDLDYETMLWLFFGKFSIYTFRANVDTALYALRFVLAGGNIEHWVKTA